MHYVQLLIFSHFKSFITSSSHLLFSSFQLFAQMLGLLSLEETVFLGQKQDEEVTEDIHGDSERDFWTISQTV
jgi:hypothetical protein